MLQKWFCLYLEGILRLKMLRQKESYLILCLIQVQYKECKCTTDNDQT